MFNAATYQTSKISSQIEPQGDNALGSFVESNIDGAMK